MRKLVRQLVALALCLLALAPVRIGAAENISGLLALADETAAWLQSEVPQPGIGDEVMLLALLRGGYATTLQEGTQHYLRALQAHVEGGGLAAQSPQATFCQAMVVAAAGLSFEKHFPTLLPAVQAATGNNAADAQRTLLLVRAQPALTAALTENAAALAAEFAAGANEDGGFGEGTSDPVSTARALQALAPYKDDEALQQTIWNADAWLQLRTNDFGGFSLNGEASAEATAEVMLAFSSLAYDPGLLSPDSAPLVSALQQFRTEGGGYAPTVGGTADVQTTALCALALVAKMRFDRGQASVYNFSDVTASELVPLPASTSVQSAPAAPAPSATNAQNAPGGLPLPVIVAVCIGVAALVGGLLLFVLRRGGNAPKGRGNRRF